MHERIGELLRSGRALVFVTPTSTVFETVQLMDAHNVGSVLILDEKTELCGIFTERDLVKRVISEKRNPETTPISDVMTSEVVVADAKMRAREVFQLMDAHKCRHIPVADGRRILGVVSLRDLLRKEKSLKEMEIIQMRSYFLDPTYPA
jgi:signal-transduction protein with cAMP-binding, CBS, and nucleotidyltransferase domain